MEHINFNKEKRYMVWGNMEMINTKYLSYFKIKSLFVLVMTIMISAVFLGCGTSTPLDGKDTDEIIIMCLEDTYPEHQFHVVESYDKQKGEGVFSDENGVEFKVMNDITYKPRYHFGCKDEYLYELLNQQGYVEKVKAILEKNDLKLNSYDEVMSTDVLWNESVDLEKLSKMISEILNCVEIPIVIHPENTTFSSGEVNYFSISKWAFFKISFTDENTGITSGESFYFEDRGASVEAFNEQMKEHIMEMQEEESWDEENETVKRVQTEFGSYAIKSCWSLNGELSTQGKYVYTSFGEALEENKDSYFVIECSVNPYTVEQHEVFKKSILSQLMKNDNLPENAQINATGFTTKNGNTAYSFEIVMSDNEVMTMHYIVGEKKHCLIMEVNYNNLESCSEAVQHVINTFSWKE